ncbi:MAG: NAD-dependent epimerase/dehydratase family protein [Aggregatilineales bacterium]
MTQITVLGGSGFLGGHISLALVNAGHDVRIFARQKTLPAHLASLEGRAEIINGDANNPDDIVRAIQDSHTVIHLIHSTVPASSMRDPAGDVLQNVVSTVRWLERLRETQVKRIIYMSSGGTVYGIPNTIPITEDHSTHPISAYGISKLSIEKYVALFAGIINIDYRILRPSNVYGIGQKLTVAQGVIGVMIAHALRGETFDLWGNGETIRDYLYVDDLAHTVQLLLDYQGDERIFNVGTGSGHTVLEIVEMVRKATGTDFKIQHQPSTGFAVPINILDASRLKAYIDWQPQISFEEGIARTVAWLKTTI